MKAPHPYPGAPNASGSGPGAVVLTLAAVLFGSVSAYFALRADPNAPAPVEASVAAAAPVHPSFAQFQEEELAKAQEPETQASAAKGTEKSRASAAKSTAPSVASKASVAAPAAAPAPAKAEPAPKTVPSAAPKAAAKPEPKAAAEPAPAPKASAATSAPAPSREAAKEATKKLLPAKNTGTLLGDLTVEELSKPEPPAFRRTVPNVGAGDTPAASRVSPAPAKPSAAVVELPSAAPKKEEAPSPAEAPAASPAPKSGTPLPRVGAAPEVVVPLKAEPLVPVPFDTKVVSSTAEKVWVQVEPTRTEIFEKGARVPGLGLFQGQDDKGNAKFGR